MSPVRCGVIGQDVPRASAASMMLRAIRPVTTSRVFDSWTRGKRPSRRPTCILPVVMIHELATTRAYRLARLTVGGA